MIILSENFRALFYAPFYAAHEISAFKTEGVDVGFRTSGSPEATAAALKAGEIDVMWGGPLRVLLHHDRDPKDDTVCFCDVVARDPFFVIGRQPRPGFRPADLAGVRFGSVSEVPTPWLCLQDDIRRDGADPASVRRVTTNTMAQNVAALQDGSLDAVQLFQPHAEELLASGAGHLWYAAASRGLTAYTTLVTRRPVIAAKRQELVSVVRAMHRALLFVRDTPGSDAHTMLGSWFPGVPAPIFAAALDRYRALALYSPDPVIRPEGVARLAACMKSGGALKRDIPFEEIVDNSLAQEVMAQPGRTLTP